MAPCPEHRPARSFATMRVIAALLLREMSTRYGKTPGGYIWSIIEPLAAIMVLSIGFALILRTPPIGTSFMLFYATGYMPYGMFNTVANMVGRSISFSKPLLQYPAVTWVDAVLARFLLNSLTSTFITLILITVILVLSDTQAVLDMIPILRAGLLALLLAFGVGVLNCAISGLFPLWEVIWSVITRPLFIASGVFFLYDDMPQLAREILWYNPLIHVIGEFRSGFYPMYIVDYVNNLFVLSVALVSLVMGLVLLGRYHREILIR
ncbi:capsular polysaccharide transport system permease protein [Pontibaca methylaminivorans]|uniref:Transport permease protein n=2 Tax=Pontibaca methylaminivorans TaxID=515897 RepID=A0A1R3X994_9RHOB|nr:capsular polysaccharide transport system permease protein [Pontibaca methylaminivorans]